MYRLKQTVHCLGKWYCGRINESDFLDQEQRRSERPAGYRLNERPIEFSFVFRCLTRAYPNRVLDVGTGQGAFPTLMSNCGFIVTATDNVRDYWPNGMYNRFFHVIDDDITATKLTEKFDFVTCISVLEHIKNHKDAVKSMISLLNPGGHLVITCPYNENQYIENVFSLSGSGHGGATNRYVCQVYSRREINGWLRANSCTLVAQEYWRFYTGHYWTFGDSLLPPLKVGKNESHQLTCLLIQKSTDE